jgi:hypothetical protein
MSFLGAEMMEVLTTMQKYAKEADVCPQRAR